MTVHLKTLALGASLAALCGASPALALGNGDYIPSPMHDILITSNIPTVNIGVRNMAASTDPADRDLQIVSTDGDEIQVSGQVWCKNLPFGSSIATRAQVRYGQLVIQANQFFFNGFSHSATQYFDGDDFLQNYSIDAPLEMAVQGQDNNWFGGFNAVNVVETRLENYVENGAGTEADFLRVDDVFNAQTTISVVGWCHYTSMGGDIDEEYVGFRSVTLPVNIFYHGDPDITDPVTAVQTANQVAQPVPNRARQTATTRGSSTQPAARSSTPARAPARRPDN